MAELEFDYVIVGAGSAGCVLANRLTENPDTTVLLLEAGGKDSSIFIQMPTALAIPMNSPKYDWRYFTEPEPYLKGREVFCPRGKALGGSSSVNGMCYVRGNAMDYQNWDQLGAKGWSYADVLPYFKKAETFSLGGDEYRGGSGPLGVLAAGKKNPLYETFIKAGHEAGYDLTDDMNGYQQEGFGRMDMTVQDGRRASAAKAYIHSGKKRQNLSIELGVLAKKIVISERRAQGIVFEKAGREFTAKARREVILSCGSINSPQLLMVSGIGPAQQLNEHGIEVKVDLPGVGENLMDHLEIYFQQECTQHVSLYGVMNPLGKAKIGAEWILTKKGLGATNHFEAGGFIRSRSGVQWADLQYHFLPLAISYDGQTLRDCHGYQAHVGPKRSRSRGWVRLRSSDIRDKPKILFNYMSHEDDWVEMRASVRLTREIFNQPAFDPYRGRELSPGTSVQTDEQIDEYLVQNVESACHPSCTCKMGDDPMAVVNAEGKVHGVKGLRVVDSSIMPHITSGDLNAPTIMLAEKMADHIKGGAMLPADKETPFYVAPDWETTQRPREPLRSIS